MKCRAKTITGQPLTFEITPEEVVDRDGHPHLQQDAIGEGFFVRSVPYAYWGGVKYRDDRMRVALERSGVDTATVEYLDARPEIDLVRFGRSDDAGCWLPLFPPVVKQPVPAYPNETIKSWGEAQRVEYMRTPGHPMFVGDFECPTEVDTYEQKLTKAVKWARDQIAFRKIMRQSGDWALHLLAHVGEARVRLGYTSVEPTEKMVEAGLHAGMKSVLSGCYGPDNAICAIWRAMEKAR